jgi:hypothetical protein
LQGHAPVNHFEVKLVDATGQNVWRWSLRDCVMSESGVELSIASHDFEFAWGPAGGGSITELGAIEFAIVAKDGGAGFAMLSGIELEDHDLDAPPSVATSSAILVATIHAVNDWQPTDEHPWLSLDLGETRLLGGAVIEWANDGQRSGFELQGSTDGATWTSLREVKRSCGFRSYLYLPNTRVRHLRLELAEPMVVNELRWQGFEFSRSIEAFWHHIAALEQRGAFPRWLLREQSLWTVIGATKGNVCALMNEEGMIELGEGSFSIEPMIGIDGELITWADVKPGQSLRDGWMPVPLVTWEAHDCRLQTEALASDDGTLRVCYITTNSGDKARHIRVYAAVRPFQVSPPWQHFRDVGGVSLIHQLDWQDGVLTVNNKACLYSEDATGFIGLGFDEGPLVDALALPSEVRVTDDFGFANGALVFEFILAPGESKQVTWSTSPLCDDANAWSNKLPTTVLSAASWAREALQAQLTATAHILITRSGAALQPGPRRYKRSWIRDGCIMSAALLRMGCVSEVRDFIRWYAPHVRADGFVPCCVDRDGADPLVEHDSHGQWIALIADYHRFTQDRELVQELWPGVVRVVDCIERLLEPDGLMPISVSHEGYLSQPVHSYWDDFWALRGLRDAVALGREFGHEVASWEVITSRLSDGLFASIEATRAAKQSDYIPGSREWADFDPTATANALTLFDVPVQLNREAVDRTFDKYLFDWRRKRTGELNWNNYTPYEIRIIGALVRLGKRDAALELLRFFLSDRRPLAWNQWPEIAWRDPGSPGHIGDVPHTWIAAEYVLAVHSLFAYETEQTVVLAAGIAPEWMDGEGVRVQALPTAFGMLSYSLHRDAGGDITFEIGDGLTLPANGIVLRAPGAEDVSVTQLPASITIRSSTFA